MKKLSEHNLQQTIANLAKGYPRYERGKNMTYLYTTFHGISRNKGDLVHPKHHSRRRKLRFSWEGILGLLLVILPIAIFILMFY